MYLFTETFHVKKNDFTFSPEKKIVSFFINANYSTTLFSDTYILYTFVLNEDYKINVKLLFLFQYLKEEKT